MFDENKHPRDNDGRFTNGSKTYRQNTDYEDILAENKREDAERIYSDYQQTGLSSKKKLTPAEKIASVHIDFNKDNILPELNDEDLEKVGSKVNKPVLLKKGD